jgi:cytoskeletal protein CcmA (bactofilin family)
VSLLGGRKESSGSAPRDPASLTVLLGEGVAFEGKLKLQETGRIDGHFKGEIESEGTLVVGATGVVEAHVVSQNVHVSGHLSGKLVVRGSLVLDPSARVQGEVETRSLVVAEGAMLEGRITMSAPAREGHLKAVGRTD